MNPLLPLVTSFVVGCALAFSVQAAPPEGKGKGPDHSAGQSGKGKSENPQRGASGGGSPGNGKGNPGKGNSGKGNAEKGVAADSAKGNPGKHGGVSTPDSAKGGGKPAASHKGGGSAGYGAYDDRGRYSGYFDDQRDARGRLRYGDDFDGLIYAGITAALAREYALDYGFGGYSSLPPGIRKNLARGKPLPPGIAKKMVPGPMLGRLPRYPGYEWRIAGSDLILISVATAVIADILYDVFD